MIDTKKKAILRSRRLHRLDNSGKILCLTLIEFRESVKHVSRD